MIFAFESFETNSWLVVPLHLQAIFCCVVTVNQLSSDLFGLVRNGWIDIYGNCIYKENGILMSSL